MKKLSVSAIIRLLLLSVLAVLFVIPVVSTAIKSFSFEGRIGLAQYWELFVTNFTYLDFFWNSVLYATAITAVCIAISLPLGFLFAKVNFRGAGQPVLRVYPCHDAALSGNAATQLHPAQRF